VHRDVVLLWGTDVAQKLVSEDSNNIWRIPGERECVPLKERNFWAVDENVLPSARRGLFFFDLQFHDV
jgi:hypothetical protein